VNDHAAIRSRSYESGDWYGVIGPHVVVILPPGERSRVAALWALVDDGAGFEETLDALVSGGLRALSGFVLVSGGTGDTKIVVRGVAKVVLVAGGERVELEATHVTTWVERSLSDVTSMVIEVADVPHDAPVHTIEHGLVRIARLSEGEPTSPVAAVVPEAPEVSGAAGVPGVPLLAPDLPDVPDLPDLPDTEPYVEGAALAAAAGAALSAAPVTAFAAGASPDVDPWIDPAPGAGLDAPLFSSPPLEPAGDDEPVEELDEQDEQDKSGDEPGEAYDEPVEQLDEQDESVEAYDEPLDDSPEEPVTEVMATSPPPEVETDPRAGDETDVIEVQDHDGLTRMSPWDDDEFALARPGIPGQEPAPAVTSRPVARLVISDGQRVEVDRVIVLGRAPMASRFSETDRPTLVRVSSPNQEVSSSHVEIRPGSGADHGTAVITDLGSTNGTVVAQPGLEPDDLQPGVSVQLIPGAIIDLGDGVTIQVVRP
jgi:hypothetical protein